MNSLYNLRSKIITLAPNLVATEKTTPEDNRVDEENVTLPKFKIEADSLPGNINVEEMATFSAEQFQQILAAMGGNARGGSFTSCTARFKGQRDPAAVEEFLAAISVFKDIERISDADSLRGMPLLLEDYAASWWIGVKDTVNTFEQATALIRSTFTPPVPDWRIFSNLFETKQQRNEPTDSFICKKRLLFAQLKTPPSETIQLNLLYGLLNLNIRERVRRENITSFEALISASREAEMFFAESRPMKTSINEDKEEVQTNRCSFCRIKGHSIETCFKKKNRDEQQNALQTIQQKDGIFSNIQQQQPKPDLMRKPTFSCYGCGSPGVYRSNCPSCNSDGKESPQYLSFNLISSTIIGHSLPAAHVEFYGLKGEVIFDSGAKTSVASLELKNILTLNKCIFQDVNAEVTLADGSVSTNKVMSTICDISIGKRVRKIRLICLPNATKNRTLLGADFLEQAGIVLNMAQKYWYFEDQPKQKFAFVNSKSTPICSMQVNEEASPCTKAVKEMSAFIAFAEGKSDISPIHGTPKFNKPRIYSPPLPKTPTFCYQDDPTYAIEKLLQGKFKASGLLTQQKSADRSDYSPQYIQPIFRRKTDMNENFSGTVTSPIKTRKVEDTDDYFAPLFSLDIKVLKESDGINLDASGYALERVLLQGEGHNEHPIEYTAVFLTSALTPVVGSTNEFIQPVGKMRTRGRPKKMIILMSHRDDFDIKGGD